MPSGTTETIVHPSNARGRRRMTPLRPRSGSPRRRFRGWEPVAVGRVFAVGVALLGALAGGADVPTVWLVGLVVYAVVLAPLSDRRASAFVDVAVAAAVLLVHSDELGLFLVLSGVAAFNAGTQLGPLRGVLLSWALSVAQLPALIPLAMDGEVTVAALAALVGLHPLTGALAGFAAQRTQRSRVEREILLDTNRILIELDRIADRVPAGLDPRSVSTAALEELVATIGTSRAFLFSGVQGILRPVAVHGEGRTPLPISDTDIIELTRGADEAIVTAADVPPGLRGVCLEHEHWLVLPLRVGSEVVGAFLAAVASDDEPRRRRQRLLDLATDAALALENARLFGGVQARATDVARRRIAHDLHDGVAQSLAHIRMELDLLSRSDLDPHVLAQEAQRLSSVAARALDDVRSTITGLRSAAVGEGIVGALRSHIDGLNGVGGPKVSFEAVGTPDLDEAVANDLLRIAQEAISNAVRHSDAMNVLVSLEAEGDLVSLAVEDDGRGLPREPRPEGIGLKAMRDRGARLGAQLTIRDRRGGGTVVVLSYTSGGRT